MFLKVLNNSFAEIVDAGKTFVNCGVVLCSIGRQLFEPPLEVELSLLHTLNACKKNCDGPDAGV